MFAHCPLPELPDPEKSALDAAAIAHLQSWCGRSASLDDTVVAAPVRALAAALDRSDAAPVAGDVLPALWHWLYFLPQARQSEIGADGHPRRGGFLPPVPLPRRMWAGGRLQWSPGNPLRLGDAVQRSSCIASVTHKAGRSGDLVFVLVQHQVSNAQGLALSEEHDIVYRPAGQPADKLPAPVLAEAGPGPGWQRQIEPDPVLLFRYSALTFNGHRIHYDRSYATAVEGYPGLVVHGPLIATLLLDLVRRQWPDAVFKSFTFKALRPLFDLHPWQLHGRPAADGKSVQLWASDHEGWLAMQASVELY